MSEPTKKRGKYGRPCDLCSSRRVRCVFHEGAEKCQGCLNHNEECTFVRIRKKSGPKPKKPQVEAPPMGFTPFMVPPSGYPSRWNFSIPATPVGASSAQEPPDPYLALISLDKLVTYLHIYQTWFYGYWPVLSVADIISKITNTDSMSQSSDTIILRSNNAFHYSLACSVCAAISTQMTFVSAKDRIINEGSTCDASSFADEARRVRNLFDYASDPSVETLLSSFFLYAHYTNCTGKTNQAIIYLREAISMSQLLAFHDPTTYENKPPAERHRWQKIYYTLLVTERYMCFENGMPVILDHRIELPSLENEEYPSLLVGFIELVKVFSVPDKIFFEEVHAKNSKQRLIAFQNMINSNDEISTTKYIQEVQSKLSLPIENIVKASESQKLNIILSRSWIQAIAWHISFEKGFLAKSSSRQHECFTRSYPLKIATDFLGSISDLPDVAFEANGPGVSVKLLEIANSLTLAKPQPDEMWLFADSLQFIFRLVNRFKSDLSLMDVYNKVAGTIVSLQNRIERPLSNQFSGTATIQELRDDEEVESLQQSVMTGQKCTASYMPLDQDTPFSQIFTEDPEPVGAFSRETIEALSDNIGHSEITSPMGGDQWSLNTPLLSNFMHPQC